MTKDTYWEALPFLFVIVFFASQMFTSVVLLVAAFLFLHYWTQHGVQGTEAEYHHYIAEAGSYGGSRAMQSIFSPDVMHYQTDLAGPRGGGLFATKDLPKGTPLSTILGDAISNFYNDGVFRIGLLTRAKTADEMYTALCREYEYYHTKPFIEANINVLLTASGAYETTKDVKAGEELLRYYGFSTWLVYLVNPTGRPVMTREAFPGYMKFLLENGWRYRYPAQLYSFLIGIIARSDELLRMVHELEPGSFIMLGGPNDAFVRTDAQEK